MKKIKYTSVVAALTMALLTTSSCKDALNINNSPNSFADVPLVDLYNASAVNVGFTGGSDLLRYSSLIMQQWSGQSTGSLNQTQQYETYLIQGSDTNNLWNSFYTNTLVNLNIIVQKGAGSPHLTGVSKLLIAYTYSLMVDTWGKIPYSQALQITGNTAPTYDDDASIYASLLAMIDSGIADINTTASAVEVPTASPIYPGAFATVAKAKWIKFANTLKLRLLLHSIKTDPSGVTTKINALLASGTFMSSNADDFNGTFYTATGAQNPIFQFELNRKDYLAANNFMVTLMGTKQDPRMATYFTPVGTPTPTPVATNPASGTFAPQTFGGTVFEGSVAGAAPNNKFSHIGSQSASTNTINYYLTGIKGEAPIHMLNYSEYLFMRAELNLSYGVALPAGYATLQALYQDAITQSCVDAGVTSTAAATYAATRLLVGTPAAQLQQIIEEKYVSNYGVAVEPWTDYRRTGFPLIAQPTVPLFQVGSVPRSLYYPQSEVNTNPSMPGQKPDLLQKVFWDK